MLYTQFRDFLSPAIGERRNSALAVKVDIMSSLKHINRLCTAVSQRYVKINSRVARMNIAEGAASGAYKVNSLSGLDEANAVDGDLCWDPVRSIWNTSILLTALIFAPFTFSWGALAVFLFLSGTTLCIGHSVGFHRRLIHQSFECPKWLERFMV